MIVVKGTEPGFRELLDYVEGVYLEAAPFSEPMTVNNPTTLTGFRFEGIGGAVCDEVQPGIVYCQFLVVDENQRRKGHATKMIEQLEQYYLEAGTELVGALVESSEGIDLWHKAGFTEQGQVNLCITKTRRSQSEIFGEGAERVPLTPLKILELLAKR